MPEFSSAKLVEKLDAEVDDFTFVVANSERCCDPEPIKYAQYWGGNFIRRNYEVTGGLISPDVFAYISDVTQMDDEGGE